MLRVLSLLLALAGAQGANATTSGRPDIVWIVVDSWRWDHVDVYRPDAALMPRLAQRAQRACIFWRAYAASSWTVPSVASLFTGQYPSFHGANMFGSELHAEGPLVARTLFDAGYRTMGISANAFISGSSSFARGFAEFVDVHVLAPAGAKDKIRATSVIKALDQWLNQQHNTQRAPLFLYLHLMDPHWPYAPPEEFLSQALPRFGNPSELRKLIGELYFGKLSLEGNVSTAIQNAIRALYAAEVMATDRALEELFAVLERHGLTSNAFIALTADHGEELFEHGHIGHGRTVFEEVLRVPLLLWFPEQKERVDIHAVVSHTDLLPTSLELAGVRVPVFDGSYPGRSLAACAPPKSWAKRLQKWFGGQECADNSRSVIAELLPLKARVPVPPLHRAAIVQGTQKLLVSSDGTMSRFDVLGTLAELDTLQPRNPGFDVLEKRWAEFEKRAVGAPPPVARTTPDPATRERLRALGYGD